MAAILNAILTFVNWAWGIPMLIWLVGGGLLLTVRFRGFQFVKLGYILKNTIGKASSGNKKVMVSGFKAVTGALASTLGAGNIIGTAMAIAYGGPGGVFWLWVTGLVACLIKYCETTLAMKYRRKTGDGWEGGPQFYLSEGTGWKLLSPLYAVLCFILLFLGASAQVGSGVDNLVNLGAPRMACTVVELLLIIAIVLGGMKGVLNMTEKIVPAMSVIYMLAGLSVIALNIQNLPAAFLSIFRYAFTGRAAFGGFAGASVAACIRWGVCRGIYSNDAGAGYTTLAHCATEEAHHPVQQGMWGVFEVFFDTLIVCNVTCFAILVTGVWETSGDPSVLTANAFSSALGAAGPVIVTVCLVLFTFTTACAQVEFAAEQLKKYLGRKAFLPCKLLFLGGLFAGGLIGITALINYVDFFSLGVILVNMIGVYVCHGQVLSLTKEYFADPGRWETEEYPLWTEKRQTFNKTGE